MTVNQIIRLSLEQLNRACGDTDIALCKDRFISYINDGISDLTLSVKPTTTEMLTAIYGRLDISELSYYCTKILSVEKDGVPVSFLRTGASMSVTVAEDGEYAITYCLMPRAVTEITDIPNLPAYVQQLLVLYCVARERMATDTSTQGGSEAYLRLYELGKRSIRPGVGETDRYTIKNRW